MLWDYCSRNHYQWRTSLARGGAYATVTRPELALVPNNCTQHSSSLVLSDHQNRWSLTSWTKLMDISQVFYGHFTGNDVSEDIKGWKRGR